MFYLTSGSGERTLSSDKKVSSVLSVLHLKRRTTFWGIFYQKQFFFAIEFGFWGKNSWTTSEKFPAEMFKLFSACPVDHFENDYHSFWTFQKFWTLSDNCADLWLKFSTAFPNVHSTCPKDFFGFFVNGSHVCFLISDSSEKNISLDRKVSSILLKLQFKRPHNILRSFYRKRVGFSV